MDTTINGLTIKDYGQQVDNDEARARADIEARYGQAWDTAQLRAEFEVTGFCAPFVVVVRRADGKRGSMEFTHSPRFYFSFTPDR